MRCEFEVSIDSERAGSGIEDDALDEPIANEVSESPQPFDLIRADGDPGLNFDGDE